MKLTSLVSGINTNKMAHSNKERLKVARGGLTRHQAAKAGNKNKYKSGFDAQDRIKELDRWVTDKQNKKAEGQPVANKRVKKHSTTASAVTRRKNAIARMEKQLQFGYSPKPGVTIMPTPSDTVRIMRELSILRKRI